MWEKQCEPQQFNDVWTLILLQMRAFLVPTTEETKSSACVHKWVGHSFRFFGSAYSWRRGHEKLGGIGQRWLEHVGPVRKMRCRDRSEGEKLRYRLARREKILGAGVHDLLDGPRTSPAKPGAIRTLRPCANNETGKKRKRTDVERHRPPPGLRRKLTARAPQSILVTHKIKTREKHVRPEDNPGKMKCCLFSCSGCARGAQRWTGKRCNSRLSPDVRC